MEIKEILRNRGINKDELVSEKKTSLVWKELELVVEKVMDLLLEVTRVGVLYDVDVDGLIAGKITEEQLKKSGLMVYRKMNSRKKHGITDEVIEWVKFEGIQLLFVVDAGTNDIKQHEILSEMGVTVIVLDHHPQWDKKEVNNVYIVNCSLHDHLPDLSGAGVCYRFVELLDKYVGGTGVSHYEPLVGLTVLSDHCSMLDPENRYYVDKLYENYNKIDLFKAFSFWGSKRNLFLFGIIPFLNACIRTNHVDWAIEAVMMSGETKVKKFVNEKKSIVLDEQSRIVEEMKAKSLKQTGKEIVLIRLAHEHLEYSGMTGLLGNKLMSELKKSVIVFYDEGDGYFRGSFRGMDAVEASELEKLGWTVMGHPQAAGVELLKTEAAEVFRKTKELELGNKDPEFDFELEDRDIVRNYSNLTAIAKFNEMTGGNLDTIKFRLKRTRHPFKNVWGKKVEYDFQSFRIRDFNLSRKTNEIWVIEPLLDREGIVLLRQ